ncbi:hypothetical protein B6I74_17205 [Klebsiella variicola]|uniref:tail fiber domain-containing protein n=1 Tax=Klebsiella variicola TaxID=244366 RepID=UPI000C799F2B|nr:tail fiber domain-containing protein [Klebsiella variicola]PLE59167.1 hypothetical protein B6I74_17205 [Klebsiella variicola]
MSDIFTGNSFKLYYNTDLGNLIPDSYKNVQVAALAAMPSVTFNSETNKIEVYDSDHTTLIVGGKTVGDLEITVNYIPDNETHMFLDAAAKNQTEFQLIIEYQTDEDGIIDYSILNGAISSYSLTGDKDAVVQKTYVFSTMNVMVRSARAVASIPLVEGSYGVGSNGVSVPQYQPETPEGNSFIKIPSGSVNSPTSADVMGIGLIDEGTYSSIALTKSGALAIYAKNGSTAWTRIVTSPMADAKYLPFSGGTISGNLNITGILSLTNALTVANGGTGATTATAARTNLDVYSKSEVDAKDATLNTKIDSVESDLSTKINNINTDIDNINTNISNVYTKAESDAKYVPKTTTVNGKALSGNITLTKSDIGLGNVTNDAQLKIASNLSDLNNAVTARGNLGLTALGIGGTPTILTSMDWLTQVFVVGGLYVVAAGGMTNTPAALVFDDETTVTMIRVVATDGTFLTCEVWPSTSTESKFRMYNIRFPSGTTGTRTFWVRRIWDSSSTIPLTSGGTGATTAAAARTSLGLGTAAVLNTGTSGNNIPLLNGNGNIWTNSQTIGTSGENKLTIVNSTFRDNGSGSLIISSNTTSTGGTGGIYLRPLGDTTSTVQLVGSSSGWAITGASTFSSTLGISGAITGSSSLTLSGKANLNGSFNGNREATDLSGITTDLNTCFVASNANGQEKVWICTTQGGGSNITNKPTNVNGSFWLQCVTIRSNGVSDSGYAQVLYSYETSKSYIRYGKSTSATTATWGDWQEQATLDNANSWSKNQTMVGAVFGGVTLRAINSTEGSGSGVVFDASDSTENSFGIVNTGGGSAVFHNYVKPANSSAVATGVLIGGYGSRPWTGSTYTEHSNVSQHFLMDGTASATNHGGWFRLLTTPLNSTMDNRRQTFATSNNGDLYCGYDVPMGTYNLTPSVLSDLNGRGFKQFNNSSNEINLITPRNGLTSSTVIRAISCNGTYASPGATQQNDEIWMGLAGHNGSMFTSIMGGIRVAAWEGWSGTNRGTGIEFHATPTASQTRRAIWEMNPNGNLLPRVDNSFSLGTSGYRVSVVYAGNGTINTSDARLKTDVRPFTNNEIKAAQMLANEVGFWSWKDKAELEKDEAREHCGMTVQRAIEIMESCDLDPFHYGFICYDKWDEEIKINEYDENDQPIETIVPAGDRYSFRIDQLNLFISRGQQAKMDSLEARLKALESK